MKLTLPIGGALSLLSGTLTFAYPYASNSTAVVRTTNGPVIGYVDSTWHTQSFRNIPYGLDTALTRFLPPKPPNPWNTIRQCLSYGQIAPQPQGSTISGTIQSEDCLNLNVWSPALDTAKRPTLVYFHGGGYDSGTVNDPAETYDGAPLSSKRDVVVVTVNHRLNGFGYIYLGGASSDPIYDRGNPGQADLILGLKWVKDNIENFGGDPENVLIFGQSGGGAKCATLMAQPDADGLFDRVWTMSGQQITGRTKEHAEQSALEALAKVAGNGTNEEKIEKMKTMGMEELKALFVGGGNRWTPVVDSTTLPRDPFSPDAAPQSKDIPMVMGNTYGETRNLIGGSKPELFNLTWGLVPAQLEANVKQYLGNMSTTAIVEDYRKQYPSYSPSDVFFAATTAARSWKSMLVQSDVRAAQEGAGLWVYYVRWNSPYQGGKWGAPHTVDIPMVFANANGLPYTAGYKGAEVLGEVVSKALVAFARTGKPAIEGLEWPRYDLQTRESMIFDDILEVHQDDRGWERKYFKDAPYVQPGT